MSDGGDPGSPLEWLRRARSDLALAKGGRTSEDVLYQDLCFHAEQAAEKALKALLVQRQRDFPKAHAIVELIKILRSESIDVPAAVMEAAALTRYAVQDRYPGLARDATLEDYERAVAVAERTLRWAEAAIPPTSSTDERN